MKKIAELGIKWASINFLFTYTVCLYNINKYKNKK